MSQKGSVIRVLITSSLIYGRALGTTLILRPRRGENFSAHFTKNDEVDPHFASRNNFLQLTTNVFVLEQVDHAR